MYEQLLQFKIERGLILCCFLKFLFINTVNADSFISSDSTEYFIINKINITGNKTTKDKIILRELLFKQEDTINKNIFDKYLLRSRENLLNTSLFNFVTILFEEIDNNRICINISVEERWYLWPYPILEHADRNLNSFIHNQKWYRFNYGLYLIKYNFRGAKEILKLKARFGFREQYGFIYSIPYIHKSQKIGLESEFFYFRQKEIIYKTENNLPVYFRLNDRYIYKSFRSKITCS
ncbi:MAG: hypothetical protein HY738_24455 [Bacteroidia bacterium]|nr:hypothetical protein [Bacteroidia bacterium]